MTPEQILAALKKHNIQVKSVEECAKAEWHVCADHLVFKTDTEDKCFLCSKPIWYSNKFPEGGPQPRRICIECALAHARGEDSFGA